MPVANMRTNKNAESREVTLDNGAQLQFALEDGGWKADLTESNGRFTRATRLPVVCEGKKDPSSVLEALFKQPCSYVNKRVHVLDARPPFAATRSVFIGQLGLLGGSPGKEDGPSSALEKSETTESKKTGSEVSLQETIVNTVALVEAFDETPSTQTDALITWANAYIDWLNESTIENAVANSGAYLMEYALLAHVPTTEDFQKQFRKAHFEAIWNKILEDSVGRGPIMRTFEYCLKTLDASVLNDERMLRSLVSDLLAKLDPDRYPMIKSELGVRRSALYSCYNVLSILKTLSPSSDALDPENKLSLYSQFTLRMEAIASAKYYPYFFHVQFLMQLLPTIQAERELGLGDRFKQGMAGAAAVYKGGFVIAAGGNALVTGDVITLAGAVRKAAKDKTLMGGIHSGYNAVLNRFGSRNEGGLREWYDFYIFMNEIVEEILREEDNPVELSKALKEYTGLTEEVKKRLPRGSLTHSMEVIALSYTLIFLDGRLALESSNGELREAALGRLRNLIDPAKKPKGAKSLKDHGLCEVYLDLLATIACHGVEESDRNFAKETISKAIEVAENTKPSLAARVRGVVSSENTSALENVTCWLQNEDLETRLASVLPPPKHCKLGDLYGIILHRLQLTQGASSQTVGGSLEEATTRTSIGAKVEGTNKE